MAEEKIINVYVTLNLKEYNKVAIPYNINEVELKALLRDLGYISSYRHSYFTTRVYLKIDTNFKEICTDEYRSLKNLGVRETSNIFIKSGETEPRPTFRSPGSMRCLYGCPMAQSVEDAINQAEKYLDTDSSITSGYIFKSN